MDHRGNGDHDYDRSDGSPPERIEELAVLPPGPVLACRLSRIDPAAMSAHDLVTVIQAWERQKSYDAARQFEAMTELARRDVYQTCAQPVDADTGHLHEAVDPCGDELSLALGWSPGRAKHQLVAAIELTEELPSTLTALRAGRLDADKATLIADRTRCLAATGQRSDVEEIALRKAGHQTRTQLDHVLRRAVIAADPAGAQERRARAAQDRRVSRPAPASIGGGDGMAFINLCGPAEDIIALHTAVDAAARHRRAVGPGRGDHRTLEQLRFDVLTSLGWTGLDNGHLGCCNPACAGGLAPEPADDHKRRYTGGSAHRPSGSRPLARRHGKAATVDVTVAASTLLGVDEQPGWLDGFGPITAQAARIISGEGPWRRLLTDPATGEVLEYGRTTYSPPARLAAHVIARDRTCRFPSCDRPAREGDIDHKYPYAAGGSTGAANCWVLDRKHHIGKTIHRYRIHTDTDGATWWTTPAGHRYRLSPTTVGPILHDLPDSLDDQPSDSPEHKSAGGPGRKPPGGLSHEPPSKPDLTDRPPF